MNYVIRLARAGDAQSLSAIRLQIDAETENLDREAGEDFMDELAFRDLIEADSKAAHNLFLVAETEGKLVGFSRCEGSTLKRSKHKVTFGIAILKTYWGFGIGSELLQHTTQWADGNDITKITLSVLETNQKAILLYQKAGFEVEGCLKNDKRLAEGNYLSTILMSRNT
ncbi:GNAT family acetyltransferase [Listeria riparia FSL S10-1204]|uniref:GNAT family acetyltransferase n=1 Tax=Listeria riparia FSL S10-1204 TaxID=1265816 RepID=W7D3B1_9LIST|nr:GNAT family N-acetyltransferase [Listeria riparia]EUJ46444.1 GNAT family acetyltransferase [Listeria riparia FSL S10-1204]